MHFDHEVGGQVVEAPPSITVDGVNRMVVSQAFMHVYCHPDDIDRVRGLSFPDPTGRSRRYRAATSFVAAPTASTPHQSAEHLGVTKPGKG